MAIFFLGSKIVGDLMEGQAREMTSKEIGEIVMKYLKTMDTIAYIRFACVYRRFKDKKELFCQQPFFKFLLSWNGHGRIGDSIEASIGNFISRDVTHAIGLIINLHKPGVEHNADKENDPFPAT